MKPTKNKSVSRADLRRALYWLSKVSDQLCMEAAAEVDDAVQKMLDKADKAEREIRRKYNIKFEENKA